MKKRVALINYINSAPFRHGMELTPQFLDAFELVPAVPSECAKLFKEGEVDVAILPVGALSTLKSYELLGDYCIGAEGPVKTVSVFANEELQKLNCIYLDTDSRSSVKLLRVLLDEFWKLSPELKSMNDFSGQLQAGEGLLCIGDKTFPMLSQYAFHYDLAEAWMKFSNLPFVFAVWVQNGSLTLQEMEMFNAAIAKGVESRAELANSLQKKNPEIDYYDYYFNCINYNLDKEKLKAINLFLEKSNKYD